MTVLHAGAASGGPFPDTFSAMWGRARVLFGVFNAYCACGTIAKGKGAMLILVRKPQEGFVISGDIQVTVLSVARDRVKIGITAPPSVRVLRDELLEPTRGDGPSGEDAP